MVTDLAEVYRLGTSKAAENLAFRRHLAERHTPDEPFRILASEVQQQIDCTACANCCRYSLVALSRRDVGRIAAHLGISADDICRLYTAPEPGASGQRILRTSDTGCVFLENNRCRIYAARPQACRDFPHVSGCAHTLGGRPASHARWAPYCPIIYNALEAYKHVTGFHARSAHGQRSAAER